MFRFFHRVYQSIGVNRKIHVVVLLILLCMSITFCIDILADPSWNVGVLYVFAIFLCINQSRRFTVLVTLFCALFMIAGFFTPIASQQSLLCINQSSESTFHILLYHRLGSIGLIISVGFLVDRLSLTNRRLRVKSEQAQNIVEAITDAIIIANREGVIIQTNKSVSILGFTPEELFGKNVDFLIPERFRHLHELMRSQHMDDPRIRNFGVEMNLFSLHKTKGEVPVEIGLSSLIIEGEPYTVATLRDATIQRNNIGQLQSSNKELEHFAYLASHDLQEPLRAITSYVQLLDRRYSDKFDEDGHEFMRFITDGALRMKTLINNLLEYSRISTRGESFVPTDLNTLLNNVLHDISLSIEEVQGTIHLLDQLPICTVDVVQLAQVFQNLILNGLKYHQETVSPIISIRSVKVGREWIFSVSDNGIGIEQQYFEKIFTIFNRVYVGNKLKGNGMGLASCKKIIERHGGHIWIESIVDQGSTFSFSLPE